MDCDEMRKLNSLGLYANIKEHLVGAHNVSKEQLPFYMALTTALERQMTYDHLLDETK